MIGLLYSELSTLREEYRRKMSVAGDRAAYLASIDEMDKVSMFSTESERYREAFHALNRVMEILERHDP